MQNPQTIEAELSEAQMTGFLEASCIPLRLACNGSAGHPVLASLWFVPHEGRLWCATQRSSRVATLLEGDPRCAFEISLEAPPYQGVRGSGIASLYEHRGEEFLQRLIQRYLGDSMPKLSATLLARAEGETAIAIEPRSLFSWDYAERMRQA
jgi:nitroimidazol reductase NimA-like FMN-containing flavoprotein (pyridoxamine 5'-phosphate oxidase superfamily)